MKTFKPILTFDELRDVEKAKVQFAATLDAITKPPRYTAKLAKWSFWRSVKWLIKHREWKRDFIAYTRILPGDPGYDDAPLEMTYCFHPSAQCIEKAE